jgi:tetratricopeptide (TPR) repeat protein
VHNFLKAFESLGEVKEWADRQHQNQLGFLVRLYLSYYEIRQKRMDKARRLLSESKQILNVNFNLIDYLNYLFYLTLWLVNVDRQPQALRVTQQLLFRSKKLPRYQTSGFYLRGLAEFRMKKNTLAQQSLKKGLALSSKWNFPQIKYLILCEQARQSGAGEDQRRSQLHYRRAGQYIRSMAENFGDEILSTQFLESKTHGDILVYANIVKLEK